MKTSARAVLVLPPIVTGLAALLLAACTTPPEQPAPDAQERVGKAATAPLSDLNLVRSQIPIVLQGALKAPYALPAKRDCADIATDVAALDAVLGADLDTPPTKDNPGMIERGSNAMGDAAIDALSSTTEGIVPFRGWVRKISGAEGHAREVSAAIAAGTIRRAYLKGLGQAAGCTAPAAPRLAPAASAAQSVAR
ncbi:MAG: hypothetical protein JO369_02980 [Paucibacter sp.]|nr:hypothetical protein [Roseateles sp.]